MDNPNNFPEKQTTTTTTTTTTTPPSWGTWEELLLACAVQRFGTDSWDSVTTEIRKRSSNLHHLTPHACKRKFHDLRRCFNQNDAVPEKNYHDDVSAIPWLDQLRQRRLDELRRELQRYDHSIVSLQLKVERLKEVSDKETEKSDPEKAGEERIAEPENVSPESIEANGVSERDDRSCNESNTTDPKPEIPEIGVGGTDNGLEPEEPDKPAGDEVGAVEKSSNPAVEDSCNGSSDTVVKEPEVKEPEKGNSGEQGESVAESKGAEEETKESPSSSEVQSSASLSRKLGQEQKPVEPVEPIKPDQEDQSPAMKKFPVESQPLVNFLEILRSHKFASFFERRLHSQDTPSYTNMIRKHVDFEMVQSRLEGGWYSRCSRSLYFRDLLLICNNAIVFFGKQSPEYKAACELLSLVTKEMALQAPKQYPPSKEETQTPPAPSVNPEPETSDLLLAKSKLSLPLNACRKRSSITARASTSSSGPDRKKEQTSTFRDVKPIINWKKQEESSDEMEKLHVTKKRRKERVRSSSRNHSSKNGRSRSNTNNDRNSDANANANAGSSSRVMTSNENPEESKTEMEKKSNNNANGKKQSAANFLSRMKKTSSSNNESLLEKLKTPENNSKGGKAEQRKNGNGKGNAHKDQGSSRGSSRRQAAKEQESPTKRNVGRPSKRAAAPTTSRPTKRARHRG